MKSFRQTTELKPLKSEYTSQGTFYAEWTRCARGRSYLENPGESSVDGSE